MIQFKLLRSQVLGILLIVGWENIWDGEGNVHCLIQELLQVNLIITLSLGSTESDHVISELCNNEVPYNRCIASNHFGSHNMAMLY